MVKLVFPVSLKDDAQAVLLADRLAKFGTVKDRDAIVVYCWGDQWNAEVVVDVFKKAFRVVHQWILPDPPEAVGWPDAANHMFYSTAERLAEHSNEEPWMWFEADCFPLQPYFLTALEKEYTEAGKPYMGAINASRYLRPDGTQFEHGRHMVGAGIYPADFMTRCSRINFVPEKIPWDIWIEDEVVPDCHDTSLIFHAWNCGKYHFVEGELIGRDLDNTTGERHKYGGRPVNHDAVVVHGLKDSSLHRIDLRQWNATVNLNGR